MRLEDENAVRLATIQASRVDRLLPSLAVNERLDDYLSIELSEADQALDVFIVFSRVAKPTAESQDYLENQVRAGLIWLHSAVQLMSGSESLGIPLPHQLAKLNHSKTQELNSLPTQLLEIYAKLAIVACGYGNYSLVDSLLELRRDYQPKHSVVFDMTFDACEIALKRRDYDRVSKYSMALAISTQEDAVRKVTICSTMSNF